MSIISHNSLGVTFQVTSIKAQEILTAAATAVEGLTGAAATQCPSQIRLQSQSAVFLCFSCFFRVFGAFWRCKLRQYAFAQRSALLDWLQSPDCLPCCPVARSSLLHIWSLNKLWTFEYSYRIKPWNLISKHLIAKVCVSRRKILSLLHWWLCLRQCHPM